MDGCKCKHRSHRCQEARIKREEAEIKGKVVVSVLGSHELQSDSVVGQRSVLPEDCGER